MEVGLLWYDDDPRRCLAEKVQQAAECYRVKSGSWPNTCFVNPSMIPADGFEHTGIRIIAAKDVMPNHFWVGIGELEPKEESQGSAAK